MLVGVQMLSLIHILNIVGVERLHGAIYRPIPDRVEAGTLLCAAAINEGSVLVRGACAAHLRSLLFKLTETGVGIRETPAGIRLSGCLLYTSGPGALPGDMAFDAFQVSADLCGGVLRGQRVLLRLHAQVRGRNL